MYNNYEVRNICLESETELRIEIELSEVVTVELKNGFAEMFGSELVTDKIYVFKTGTKLAIFTWQGCILEVKAKNIKNICYIAKKTPMRVYLNCHACLEQLREKSEINFRKKGPVVMVVGSVDSGKTTLCRLLLNYAIRMNSCPLYIDLDVDETSISMPGTIASILPKIPADIENGFIGNFPLAFHFGHVNIEKNLKLYKEIISLMAETVFKKMKLNKKVMQSGVIINTCGNIKNHGYHALLHTAKSFEANIILVLGQEKLYNELLYDMNNFTNIVLLPKSGGTIFLIRPFYIIYLRKTSKTRVEVNKRQNVFYIGDVSECILFLLQAYSLQKYVVERNQLYKAEARNKQVRQYFYGTSKFSLHPLSFEVQMSSLKIFKIGVPSLPNSCLPHGVNPSDYTTKIITVQPGMNLLNHLLAISYALKEEDILSSNVQGYICVTNVNMESQTIRILSPYPKPKPEVILLLSDLQFME